VTRISARKFEAFEKAYERGLKGKIETFDVWLQSLGLDPVLFESLQDSILQNPELTVDREKELEAIAEFIGFYERQPNQIYHLPLIGVLGSGKTQLFHLVAKLLEKLKTELTWQIVDASTFSEIDEESETEEKQAFYQLLDELRKKHTQILLVDSCDEDKNIIESLRQIAKTLKKGLIITSWTSHYWNHLRDSIEETIPVSKEVFVGPLSSEDTSDLIGAILQKASKGKFRLTPELPKKIHSYSKGIPGVTVNLLVTTLRQAFVQGSDRITVETVDNAAETLGIKGIDEKVAKLADHQLVIVRHILLENDKRGMSPSKLVELLGKDKATVSYHLTSLTSERLLAFEKVGRYSFYYIRPGIEPFIQLRIAQESEFLA